MRKGARKRAPFVVVTEFKDRSLRLGSPQYLSVSAFRPYPVYGLTRRLAPAAAWPARLLGVSAVPSLYQRTQNTGILKSFPPGGPGTFSFPGSLLTALMIDAPTIRAAEPTTAVVRIRSSLFVSSS